MRIVRAAVLFAGLASACAACGNYDAPPTLPSDYHGVAVTGAPGSPALPALPSPSYGIEPKIVTSAQDYMAEQMADDLEWQFGSLEPVTPSCDKLLVFTGATKSFGCNATRDGISVPFKVTIGGDANPYFNLDVVQLKGVITATQVREAWSRRFTSDAPVAATASPTLTCDKSIPAVALVPLDTATPYRCAVSGLVYFAEVSTDPLGDQSEYQIIFTNTPPS